jgi:hypothetical protein
VPLILLLIFTQIIVIKVDLDILIGPPCLPDLDKERKEAIVAGKGI